MAPLMAFEIDVSREGLVADLANKPARDLSTA
jgi:hypothetical protein